MKILHFKSKGRFSFVPLNSLSILVDVPSPPSNAVEQVLFFFFQIELVSFSILKQKDLRIIVQMFSFTKRTVVKER